MGLRSPTGSTRHRSLVLFGALLFLTGCSESITVLASHACAEPISLSLDDGEISTVVTLEPGEATEVWGICCEPGADGELTVGAGAWKAAVDYDLLRDDPVIVIPEAACKS